ncbi:MAG: ATP-binding cassette domain-containing protein [Burkholderiales bacterium]|nr:ATP-binding cassette domain-containing protein [Burkholderiales bacterium]
MTPELQLSKVSRHWAGVPALQDITMSLKAGERVALIGPSGGGKSTLIQMMAGALRPSAGVIEVNGRAMADFSWSELQRYRSQCRIVEQQSLLVPQSTVHQNVLSGLLSTWPWPKVLLAWLFPIERARVHDVLAQLGMAQYQWAQAGELSGGQMQRVAIARALIAEPGILLADEPTASLDPNTARLVTQQIIDAAKARHMSLVFCTHWFDIVKRDCTRVIGIKAGRVLFDLPPDQVSPDQLEQLYAGSSERI